MFKKKKSASQVVRRQAGKYKVSTVQTDQGNHTLGMEDGGTVTIPGNEVPFTPVVGDTLHISASNMMYMSPGWKEPNEGAHPGIPNGINTIEEE